jgi:hypothetical protein
LLRLSIIEKGSNGLSLQQDWTALIHHGKALLDPKPHGVFCAPRVLAASLTV